MESIKFHTSEKVKNAKRIVIKIGSSTLTYDTGKLNLRRIESLVKVAANYANAGKKIILVSSGAVSAGSAKLGIKLPLERVEDKKAAAAVGQAELMKIYDRFFSDYGIKIAQILITRDAVENEVRRTNTIDTLELLLKMDCVPIVNENDTVSSDEIKFSGNDILSAYVAQLCRADLLINLTDVGGLYDKNPARHSNARFIPYSDKVDDLLLSFGGEAGSLRGVGGMAAKLQSVKMLEHFEIPVIIASGKKPEILYDILEGTIYGTFIENSSAAEY